MTRWMHPRAFIFMAPLAMCFGTEQAKAIPAFAQQTGQPCTGCHVGGFGPQLTPTGRAFKIGGYTQQGGEGIAAMIPLSLMVQTSFTNTGAALPADAVPQHYNSNNNVSLDQISGFVGGGIGTHTGGFMQFTWSDVGNTSHVDNVDLRPYTTTFDVGGKELRIGTTLNNAPSVQDPYNTTFAWSFPYIASAVAPAPLGGTLLTTGFGQSAIGYTIYAWYDNKLYLEGGAYSTLGSWALSRIGNSLGVGSTTNPAPYLRAAYEWQWDTSAAHVGATYMHTDVSPMPGSAGDDHYTDYSVDAGYQFLGDGTHIVTAQGTFYHEEQNLKATAAGTGFGSQYSLNEIRANLSYWYQNTYGVTLGWQRLWGSPNALVFATGSDVSGSASGKPGSNAFVVEADWVPFGKDNSFGAPFLNLKLGIQYTAYTQFNGAASNYDGFGRSASDNNTLLLFAWFIF